MHRDLKHYTILLLVLLLVPTLIFSLALLILETKLDPEFNIAWFITSFSILSSVAGMFYFTCHQIQETADNIHKINQETPKQILDLLAAELRNTRIPLHGKIGRAHV